MFFDSSSFFSAGERGMSGRFYSVITSRERADLLRIDDDLRFLLQVLKVSSLASLGSPVYLNVIKLIA